MKTLLSLLAVSLLTQASHAQTRQLTGFLEIPFGTDAVTAQKSLEQRTNAQLDRGKTISSKVWFAGGSFAGLPTNFLILEFFDGKLSKGIAFIKRGSTKDREEYKTLKKMLTEKYGTRNSEDISGKIWQAEWRFSAPGAAIPDTIELQSERGDDHACKVIYSSSRFMKPAAGISPTAPKKDL